MTESKSSFDKLSAINVNEHIEKKNGLSYLSWAWAVTELLKADPLANWEYKEPLAFGETLMVFCTVTAFGKAMTSQLPVMDYKNKAIPNPDAYQVNTAMQRCLAKAIALHGLGLYIYAGEDLPEEPVKEVKERLPTLTYEDTIVFFNKWENTKADLAADQADGVADETAINEAWFKYPSNVRTAINKYGKEIKEQLNNEELDRKQIKGI